MNRQQRKQGIMAHVTSFKFQAKPGERQAVIDSFQRRQMEMTA